VARAHKGCRAIQNNFSLYILSLSAFSHTRGSISASRACPVSCRRSFPEVPMKEFDFRTFYLHIQGLFGARMMTALRCSQPPDYLVYYNALEGWTDEICLKLQSEEPVSLSSFKLSTSCISVESGTATPTYWIDTLLLN
jgi:hypothetical protein